jgi:hypothetical protein
VAEFGINNLFESTAHSAVFFKYFAALVGLACVFIGGRLFVRRVDAPQAVSRRLFSLHRGGPGAIVGVFGMAVIALALLLEPATTPSPEPQGNASSADVTEVAPLTAGGDTRPGAPSSSESGSTRVRHDFDSPARDRFFPPEPVATDPGGKSGRIRGAAGVQTKGAYVPFAKPPAEISPNSFRPSGSFTGTGTNRRAAMLLSNKTATANSSSNRLRAPFNVRIANP